MSDAAGVTRDDLVRLQRQVTRLQVALGVACVALAALAAWTLPPRQLSCTGLVVKGRGGVQARLDVEDDGRTVLSFVDAKGVPRLELVATSELSALNLEPRGGTGPERVGLNAGQGAALRLQSGDRAVELLAADRSLAVVRVTGAPGVTGELSLGADTPQLTLLRGDTTTDGGVTDVRLGADATGGQLSLARVQRLGPVTVGKRAELWAGYPGADAGASLELSDDDGSIRLQTAPGQGGPRVEVRRGGKSAWTAP